MRRAASFPKTPTCIKADEISASRDPRLRVDGGPVHVGTHEIQLEAGPKVSLILLHDVSYIELHRVTRRINDRFGQPGCQPIHLLATHHEHEQVNELFRAADVCVVTSLHDGMNLVCKEFIAARDDERGVLILSRFAGAARELPESLIVNPYHVEETADAMHQALLMPEAEQRERAAQPESNRQGIQCLSLGRPHAGRCRTPFLSSRESKE